MYNIRANEYENILISRQVCMLITNEKRSFTTNQERIRNEHIAVLKKEESELTVSDSFCHTYISYIAIYLTQSVSRVPPMINIKLSIQAACTTGGTR